MTKPAHNALPYREVIATFVRKRISEGVSKTAILQEIQKYQDAPKTWEGLHRLYGADMAEAKNIIDASIGNVVIKAAKEGDFKSAELYLKSRGGWGVEEKIVVKDEDDLTTEGDAADYLMNLLGIDDKKEE